MFLVKYTTQGKLVWIQSASGPGFDGGASVAIDRLKNSYVAGFFSGALVIGTGNLKGEGPSDGFVAKYGSEGELLWVNSIVGPGLSVCTGVTVDNEGNAYVTGTFTETVQIGSSTLAS
jgi:hypothetical protein